MHTRSALRAMPLAQLHPLADAALRASAERYDLRPTRATGLPLWLLCEIVLSAQLRRRDELAG